MIKINQNLQSFTYLLSFDLLSEYNPFEERITTTFLLCSTIVHEIWRLIIVYRHIYKRYVLTQFPNTLSHGLKNFYISITLKDVDSGFISKDFFPNYWFSTQLCLVNRPLNTRSPTPPKHAKSFLFIEPLINDLFTVDPLPDPQSIYNSHFYFKCWRRVTTNNSTTVLDVLRFVYSTVNCCQVGNYSRSHFAFFYNSTFSCIKFPHTKKGTTHRLS